MFQINEKFFINSLKLALGITNLELNFGKFD